MLVKIAVPSINTKEFFYIVILTILLVIRTMMSIWLAEVNGKVVKAIVNRSLPGFLRSVIALFRVIIDIDCRIAFVLGAIFHGQLCYGILF